VAIVGYIGQYVAKRQIAATLPIIKLYNPGLYLPAHHDEIAGTWMMTSMVVITLAAPFPTFGAPNGQRIL
jgi:hypothetical protein